MLVKFETVEAVAQNANQGLQHLSRKGIKLFRRNPVLCVMTALVAGFGAAVVLYSKNPDRT